MNHPHAITVQLSRLIVKELTFAMLHKLNLGLLNNEAKRLAKLLSHSTIEACETSDATVKASLDQQ
jgi:hypothetical protein